MKEKATMLSKQASKQASKHKITLSFFSCQIEFFTKLGGVFCPIYHGRDAPFVFVAPLKINRKDGK